MTRKEFLALLAAGSTSQVLAQNDTPAAATPPTRATPKPAATPKAAAQPLTLPPIQPGPTYLLAGPMLGHVGPNEARFWVRATAPTPWKIRVSESPTMENAREINGPALGEETAHSGIAVVGELKAATRYFYQVWLEDRPQQIAPLPSFVTAPENGTPGRQRILFGSCVGDSLASAAPSWAEFAARRDMGSNAGGFDVLLMLGDNHYANSTKIEKLRTYYAAHRLTSGWRELSGHRPVYAIWDDHDYGPNNSDGTSPGKAEALRAFREAWANPAVGEPENPGCYFTFQRGDVQFFMLDGRYHRTPNKAADGPEKTMFGAGQLAWLKRELAASKAKIKLLANGSEWQSHGSDDSFSLFRHERDALLRWIDEQKVEGVILLSGDRHVASGYHVLQRFVELSSGPFGSGNATLRPNAERFIGWDDGRLWFILDIDTTGAEPAVSYELWQTGGGRLERRAFTWDQLHGRAPIAASPSPLRQPRGIPKAMATPKPA